MNLSKLPFIFFVIFMLSYGASASTKKIDLKWGSILGAEKYEYQLSKKVGFEGEFVRSGTTTNTYFVTSLNPGVYFLRVRAIGANKKLGVWSQATRIVVEASDFSILKPSNGETIEIASPNASFVVEWRAVEGADDYLIQVRREKEQRNIISPTNSVRLEGFGVGAWNITIMARSGGQTIQKSPESNFKIAVNSKPKPVVYSPVSGETAIAWDHFSIRWLNNTVSNSTEVVIKRMGSKNGVISREVVRGRSETMTPRLPPGNYQIAIRNIFDSSVSESAVVEVTVVEDAMGYHKDFFGLTSHVSLGPTYGVTGYGGAAFESSPIKFKNFSGEAEARLTGDISHRWGFELLAGVRGDRFGDTKQIPSTDNFVKIETTRVQPNLYGGTRYKLDLLGPSKPIWIRGGLYWRGIEMPVDGIGEAFDLAQTSSSKFINKNAPIVGLMVGSEIRWGGFRSRWDVLGRTDIYIPIAGGSRGLGTDGVSLLWPGLELRVFPRVKIASDLRIGMTIGGRIETITFKETSSENSQYISRRFFLIPSMSWDL